MAMPMDAGKEVSMSTATTLDVVAHLVGGSWHDCYIRTGSETIPAVQEGHDTTPPRVWLATYRPDGTYDNEGYPIYRIEEGVAHGQQFEAARRCDFRPREE